MTTINEVQVCLQNLLKVTVSQTEIAKALNTGRSNISLRIKNKSGLKIEELKKIEDYFKVDLSGFIARDNLKKQINEYLLLEEKESDFLELRVRGEVSASLGFGMTVYDESQTGTYKISKELARDLNINSSAAEVIFASGDSMYPTIEGGDSLIVDTSKTEIYDGRIYCVRIDGQLYAKRLQLIPPKKIKVISDNQDKYDAFYVDLSKEIEYDFAVIGEVRYWGRIAK